MVVDGKDEVVEKSARNIPYVKVLRVEGLNVYDVIRHEQFVVTLDAVKRIEEVLITMNEYDIVIRPIVTEKSSLLKETGNQYVFEVARRRQQD